MRGVALCSIGRMENAYAVEFVEHYKGIGFTHIFIYDNNHDGEEHFEEVLSSYIDCGFVTIIDWRNKEKAQKSAYMDCYNRFGKEYEWIAFFDFDEYLVITNNSDIGTFLNRFNSFECVLINWMNYTDGDMLRNDGRPLQERFTVPMSLDKSIGYDFPENNHVKSIVRGGLSVCVFDTNPHVPSTPLLCCNTRNERCSQYPWQPYDHSVAYLKHFTTKTIEEWLSNKMLKGTGGRRYQRFIETYKDYFFKVNKKTKEKEEFIRTWQK